MGDPNRLWTMQDLADYLGVSKKTLQNRPRSTLPPRANVVGAVRFRESDVYAWVASKVEACVNPQSGVMKNTEDGVNAKKLWRNFVPFSASVGEKRRRAAPKLSNC